MKFYKLAQAAEVVMRKLAINAWTRNLGIMTQAEKMKMPWRSVDTFTKGLNTGSDNLRAKYGFDLKEVAVGVGQHNGEYNPQLKRITLYNAPGDKPLTRAATYRHEVDEGRSDDYHNKINSTNRWKIPSSEDDFYDTPIPKYEWTHLSPSVIAREMNILRNLPPNHGAEGINKLVNSKGRRNQYNFVNYITGNIKKPQALVNNPKMEDVFYRYANEPSELPYIDVKKNFKKLNDLDTFDSYKPFTRYDARNYVASSETHAFNAKGLTPGQRMRYTDFVAAREDLLTKFKATNYPSWLVDQRLKFPNNKDIANATPLLTRDMVSKFNFLNTRASTPWEFANNVPGPQTLKGYDQLSA